MIKKLALDKTKVYEKKIALYEISKMLVDFVKGQKHYFAVGSEQGEINTWDDFVIETESHKNIYIQAKRQTTPFSRNKVIRAYKQNGPKKGLELQDLSPLDETIEALGKVMLTNKHDDDSFWIYLPEASVEIKKDLTISNLRTFRESITPLSEASKLDIQIANDKVSEQVYLWLTTWCGFQDSQHIIKAFNRLYIKTTSYESELYESSKRQLLEIFNPDLVDTVCTLIMAYCEDNETFTSAIKPRELLFYLRDYLKPEVERWSQFSAENSIWNISGIHDISNNDCCERADVVVDQLWNVNNESHSLKITGKIDKKCCLTDSLLRLCIHLTGPVNIYSDVTDILICNVQEKTGETLGNRRSDIEDLRIIRMNSSSLASDYTALKTLDEIEEYSNALNKEMLILTLKYVDQSMIKKIRSDINQSQLRTDVETYWNVMKADLMSNLEELKKLFSEILHPDIESRSVSGEIRTGLKTVELITNSLFMYIIIKICINDYDQQYIVRAIGLNYWSGPCDNPDMYDIDDSRTIDKLLSNQKEDILLLTGTRCPASVIYSYSLTGESVNSGSLSDINYPKLLVTNDERIKTLIRMGDCEKIKAYLSKKMDEYKYTYNNSINAIVGE